MNHINKIIRLPSLLRLSGSRFGLRCSLRHVSGLGTNNGIANNYNANNNQMPGIKTTLDDFLSPNDSLEQPSETDTDRTNDRTLIQNITSYFARFEERCQIHEIVNESDYKNVFLYLRQSLENGLVTDNLKGNLSLLMSTLLRCCGKLMSNVPANIREQYAGELWAFIKQNKLNMDTSIYNSLIRCLNENNSLFDPEKMLQEIQEVGLKPDRVTYQRLIHQYCLKGDIDGATKLLEEMKSLELPLNEQIFASLIIGYGQQENYPPVKDMFELMKSNCIEPSGKSLTAAIIAVSCRISKPGALEELKELLAQMKTEDIQLTVEDCLELIESLEKFRDNPTVYEAIESIAEYSTFHGFSKRIFRALLKCGLDELASKVYWSKKPTERAIADGYVGSFYIKLLLETDRPIEFIFRECDQFIKSGYQPKVYHTVFFLAATQRKMEIMKASLKKIKEDSQPNHTIYWPLIAQAKDDKELTDILINHIDHNVRSSDLLETLADWVWPKFSDNFEKFFELNNEIKINNGIMISSFINYVVRKGRIDEAIELITSKGLDLTCVASQDAEIDQQEQYEVDTNGRPRGSNRKSTIGFLLNQIAEQTKDPEQVKKAFEMSLVPGSPTDVGLVMPLIKVHLLNDDFQGAIETFLKIVEQYNLTPRRRELMTLCLTRKDPENLQRIIDVVGNLFGQSEALLDLTLACLEANKMKQAQKIVSSPNFRIAPNRIYGISRMYLNTNRIDKLEMFVELCSDIHGSNRDILYGTLIQGYRNNKMGAKALELWNKMQENVFQPSKQNLLRLAQVLEESSIEVPFQKPTMVYHEQRWNNNNNNQNIGSHHTTSEGRNKKQRN